MPEQECQQFFICPSGCILHFLRKFIFDITVSKFISEDFQIVHKYAIYQTCIYVHRHQILRVVWDKYNKDQTNRKKWQLLIFSPYKTVDKINANLNKILKTLIMLNLREWRGSDSPKSPRMHHGPKACQPSQLSLRLTLKWIRHKVCLH